MPKYTITMDGKKYTVTADSEDDAIAALTMPEEPSLTKGLLQSLDLGGRGLAQTLQQTGDLLYNKIGQYSPSGQLLRNAENPVDSITDPQAVVTQRQLRNYNLHNNVGAQVSGSLLETLPSTVVTSMFPQLRGALLGDVARRGIEGAAQGMLLPHTTDHEQVQNTAIGGGVGTLFGTLLHGGGALLDSARSVFAKEPNAQALVEHIAKLKAGENATSQDIANIALSSKYAIDYGMADKGSYELSDLWHPSSYYTQDPIDRTAVAYARRAGGSTFDALEAQNQPVVDNYLTHLPEHYNLGETSGSFYDKFLGRNGVGPAAIEKTLRDAQGLFDGDAMLGYFKNRMDTTTNYPPYNTLAARVFNYNNKLQKQAERYKQIYYSNDPEIRAMFTPAMQTTIDQAARLQDPKYWDSQVQWIEDSLPNGGFKSSLGGQDKTVLRDYIDQATDGEYSKAREQFKGFNTLYNQISNMEDITNKYVGTPQNPRLSIPTSDSLTSTLLKLEAPTEYGTLQLDPGAMQGYGELRDVLRRHEQSMPSSVTDEEFKINPRFNAVARIGGSAIGNEAGWAAARLIQLLGGRNTEQNLVRIMAQPEEYSRLLKQVAEKQLYPDAQRSILAEKLPALFGNLAAQWSN